MTSLWWWDGESSPNDLALTDAGRPGEWKFCLAELLRLNIVKFPDSWLMDLHGCWGLILHLKIDLFELDRLDHLLCRKWSDWVCVNCLHLGDLSYEYSLNRHVKLTYSWSSVQVGQSKGISGQWRGGAPAGIWWIFSSEILAVVAVDSGLLGVVPQQLHLQPIFGGEGKFKQPQLELFSVL